MGKIGIIGSGVAGLTTAIRMQAAGHRVTVFETNTYPGGKLTAFDQDGFRFDSGPSLFTMPQLLDEVFTVAGKNPRDYYTYQHIDPGCHYFWEDGTRFQSHADIDVFAEAASKAFGEPKTNITTYLEKSFELYDITEDVFLKSSLHKASTYLKWSTLRSFVQLYKARLFSSMNEVNTAAFESPKLTQLFNRYATYNGSDPYRAPGTLTVIPTLEYRWGTALPKGGMHSITMSLYQLACDLGVDFHFEEKVENISTDGKKIQGLITKKGTYQFDTVISNMDVVPTYRNLLKGHKPPVRIEKQERSSSALIFYWGIDRQFEALGLHNIFWSENYREEFRQLFEEKDIYYDPTVYINITSKYETGDAPDGCENWFVMVNAPYSAGQNWDELISKTRKNILAKLERMLGIPVEPLISTERILDPPGIESQTSSHLGSLYGTSSNSMMAAFLRHPNFSSRIKNLYFCGGSAHPGGGIPLCLLSGKIVSELAR